MGRFLPKSHMEIGTQVGIRGKHINVYNTKFEPTIV